MPRTRPPPCARTGGPRPQASARNAISAPAGRTVAISLRTFADPPRRSTARCSPARGSGRAAPSAAPTTAQARPVPGATLAGRAARPCPGEAHLRPSGPGSGRRLSAVGGRPHSGRLFTPVGVKRRCYATVVSDDPPQATIARHGALARLRICTAGGSPPAGYADARGPRSWRTRVPLPCRRRPMRPCRDPIPSRLESEFFTGAVAIQTHELCCDAH